ncbi:MAG: thermonuclease family protein [Nitrospinae bacterium]|nr:thermonuclease family protein [Nitrospinota bacterium]
MKRILITFLGVGFLFVATECFAEELSGKSSNPNQKTLPVVSNFPPRGASALRAGVVLSGKVIAVMDGDTLTFETTAGNLFKVRLKEVDAPQSGQTFGRQARQFVEDLVRGKSVDIKYETADRYGKAIGEVILPDGRILNKELVRHGFAWHYRVHYPVDESLRELEYQAWKKKVGLWVDPSAIPPWEFRRENISPQEPPVNPSDVDYDDIFNYGLIGDPETKLFMWPNCRNYPHDSRGFAVFGSKLEAKTSGFRISQNCVRR